MRLKHLWNCPVVLYGVGVDSPNWKSAKCWDVKISKWCWPRPYLRNVLSRSLRCRKESSPAIFTGSAGERGVLFNALAYAFFSTDGNLSVLANSLDHHSLLRLTALAGGRRLKIPTFESLVQSYGVIVGVIVVRRHNCTLYRAFRLLQSLRREWFCPANNEINNSKRYCRRHSQQTSPRGSDSVLITLKHYWRWWLQAKRTISITIVYHH